MSRYSRPASLFIETIDVIGNIVALTLFIGVILLICAGAS